MMSFWKTGRQPAGAPGGESGREGQGKEASSSPDESTVLGERGIASINQARSIQSRVSNLLAMGLMSSLGLGLLTWYYAQVFSKQSQVRQQAQSASKAKAQGEMTLPSLGRIDPPAPMPIRDANGHPVVEQVLGPPPDAPSVDPARPVAAMPVTSNYPSDPAKSPYQLALERQLSGPAFSEPGSSRGNSPSVTALPESLGAVSDAASADGTGRGAAGDGGMAALLRPSVTPAVAASVLPTQRLLLPKGAFIDCTLETAIDSSLPGLTTCITATDTFSADGKVVLLERGTKLVGETRGDVRQGSSRVFVLWTEARTPTGVVIPLSSPGTDELGRSGLPGTVNNHFLARFGAAILISVIDGAIQTGVTSTRSSGGTVIYNPSGSQDIVTEVLKGTVNIPPTVSKQNGDRIQVLVARDLDFRTVYELRPVADR
ncbi:MAG TPA: type IV secretion system protein VirB10 [Steroidobacteraceae bacterium]|jgi:type IV secretion system protein VirB10